MAKSYKEQFKAIKQDVRKNYDNITKDLAKKAKQDLICSTQNIIQNYYDSFNPDYYVRTHNLYHMVYPHLIQKKDNGHVASVTTGSVLMYDNYNISPDVVYNLVWYAGHRGLPYQSLPSWYPQISVNGINYSSTTPHNLMKYFVLNWGKNIGQEEYKTISKKYISKKNVSFI